MKGPARAGCQLDVTMRAVMGGQQGGGALWPMMLLHFRVVFQAALSD